MEEEIIVYLLIWLLVNKEAAEKNLCNQFFWPVISCPLKLSTLVKLTKTG